MDFIERFAERCYQEDKHMLYAQMRKNGEIVQDYRLFPKETRLNTMSISKSFVSAAVGMALEEGIIHLDEKICDAFPEYVPSDANEYLLNTTLRHMLTMTTGLSNPLFFADSEERYQVKDWIDYFFHAEFDHASGEKFLYCNFNTYMLSALIEKRVGQNLLEYLRYRLFEPIGICNPEWTLCPKGHVYAANGLYLTNTELGNYGELLLRNGNWKGKQLIPEWYVKEATAKHVETKLGSELKEDSYGYGYQIWMNSIPGSYILCGNYGQYCLVLPKQDLVLNVMSLEGREYKRIRDILIEMVKEELLP